MSKNVFKHITENLWAYYFWMGTAYFRRIIFLGFIPRDIAIDFLAAIKRMALKTYLTVFYGKKIKKDFRKQLLSKTNKAIYGKKKTESYEKQNKGFRIKD